MLQRYWFSAAAAVLVSLSAQGQSMYFLADGPRLTKADNELFEAAAAEALNEAADGDAVEWSNPDTGAGGVITVVDTVSDDVYGHCRRVRVLTEARGKRRQGVYRACRATNGTWRLLSAGRGAAQTKGK